VGVVDAWQASRSAKTSHDPVREAQSDAVLGLISLGYKQGEAQKAVNEIAKQPGFDPASSADKIIREALRSMN
jgi:Holliday junction resolvasome RuvABC DNA-binding subunit